MVLINLAHYYGKSLLQETVFLRYDFCSNNDKSKTLEALTLILARNGCSSQHPASQPLSVKFTMVNKSHSQHSVVAVRCEGRHFLILYACAHEVSFPGQYHAHWSQNDTSAQGKHAARKEEYEKWHFCYCTLLHLAVSRVAFGQLYESC